MIFGRLKTLCLSAAWSSRLGARLSRCKTDGRSPGPTGRVVVRTAGGGGGGGLEPCSWNFAFPWSDGARRRLNCWSCQRALLPAHFFCPSCNALQPPDASRDYFEIMDCERSFNVDIQKLQQKFRDLQRSFHPDYYSQKSQLKLSGIELEEGTDSDMETQFLTDILEINEKLAEAHSETEIQDVGNFVEANLEELTEDVGKAFKKGDLQEAKILLAKMQYFSNLIDKVKEKIIPS